MTTAQKTKKFYSCPDTASVREVPQPIQHQVNANRADQLDGRVAFYIMEEWYTLDSQEVIRSKVMEKPDVDGVIFFRLSQFYHSGKPNLELMRFILKSGYELHFSRERLAICTEQALDELASFILSCSYVDQRDRSREFINSLIPMLDEADRRKG